MPLVDLEKLSPSSFPKKESDVFEFKSSQIDSQKLKRELDRAASAFGNSGGGCLIAGVDNATGDPDGGLEARVGRQPLEEWMDQIIHLVDPTPFYKTRLYDDCEGRGTLAAGKVIAAVSVQPSLVGPHMASDHKYYIRAGAHTVEAGHYLVEALWARRQVAKPLLSHVVREKPNRSSTIQVGVIALTDAPAVDVEINFNPLPELLKDAAEFFPRRLPVISTAAPFFMDISLYGYGEKGIPKDVKITIAYKDLAGNEYSYESSTAFVDALQPTRIGEDSPARIARALEKIADGIRKLK